MKSEEGPAVCNWPLCLDETKSRILCENIVAANMGEESRGADPVCELDCDMPDKEQ